ncbi:uncharacterized protein [Rutidosis leptorrhynchoides]|uniref:uncharacterized protein n=1 Tax=Rutidosis leptorrhynchoides TaxID=125765 RepID=UPI003A996827
MSSFLFFIVTKGLHSLIREKVDQGSIRALLLKWIWRVKVSRNSYWASIDCLICWPNGGIADGGKYIRSSIWSNFFGDAKAKGSNTNLANSLWVKVGNGSSSQFWLDNWRGGGSLKQGFPQLYHIAVNKVAHLQRVELGVVLDKNWPKELDSFN